MGGCFSDFSDSDKVSLLYATPFFSLKEEELYNLASVFDVRRLSPGQYVYREGEPGSEFFVVGEGELAVTSSDATGRQVRLCSKHKGDFFGHEAIFTEHHVRKSNVIASRDTILLFLTQEHYTKFLLHNSHLRRKLECVMGKNMERQLRRVPFIKQLNEDQMNLLAALMQYETFHANEVVFRQGDLGMELYIIVQGRVFVDAVGGVEMKSARIAELEPGDYFGEVSLMVNMPRNATVTAQEECLMLVLRKEDFINFFDMVPELREAFDLEVKKRTSEHFKAFKIPFFEHIPSGLYLHLAEIVEIEEFKEGEVVFNEGDRGTKFYIVVFGVCVVSLPSEANETIDELGPGRFFGEVALVKDCERSASVTCKSRCVLYSIEKEMFREFFSKNKESLSTFELKLAREEAPLCSVLFHNKGLELFTKHLQSEFSAENVQFWHEVQEFKSKENAELESLAEVIVDRFVSAGSSEQVNIPARMRVRIRDELKNGNVTRELFAEAEEEIMKLMEEDPFKRFKTTPLWQELIESVGGGYNYPSTDGGKRGSYKRK